MQARPMVNSIATAKSIISRSPPSLPCQIRANIVSPKPSKSTKVRFAALKVAIPTGYHFILPGQP